MIQQLNTVSRSKAERKTPSKGAGMRSNPVSGKGGIVIDFVAARAKRQAKANSEFTFVSTETIRQGEISSKYRTSVSWEELAARPTFRPKPRALVVAVQFATNVVVSVVVVSTLCFTALL